MPRLCVMVGVRQYDNEDGVELWRHDESGRLVVRAFNEGGCCYTDVDLWDILGWLAAGPSEGMLARDVPRTDCAGSDLRGGQARA